MEENMRPTTASDDNVFDFQALLHPGTVFEHPRDVVTHPSLSLAEKRANVLKLYRVLRKTGKTQPNQVVFYDPGVGTLARPDPWTKLKQDAVAVLGLATGYGLDDNVLAAYGFLVSTRKVTKSISSASVVGRTPCGFSLVLCTGSVCCRPIREISRAQHLPPISRSDRRPRPFWR
jgi:hypothetical protein